MVKDNLGKQLELSYLNYLLCFLQMVTFQGCCEWDVFQHFLLEFLGPHITRSAIMSLCDCTLYRYAIYVILDF